MWWCMPHAKTEWVQFCSLCLTEELPSQKLSSFSSVLSVLLKLPSQKLSVFSSVQKLSVFSSVPCVILKSVRLKNWVCSGLFLVSYWSFCLKNLVYSVLLLMSYWKSSVSFWSLVINAFTVLKKKTLHFSFTAISIEKYRVKKYQHMTRRSIIVFSI